MKNFRSQFLAISVSLFLCFALMFTGCSTATSDEVIMILNIMQPAVEGLIPIIAIANPSQTQAVTAGVGVFEGAVKVITVDYNDWKTANATAQPALLDKIQTDIAVAKADFNQTVAAMQVKDQKTLSFVDGFAAVFFDEFAQIASVVAKGQAGGGTTVAVNAAIDSFRTGMSTDVMFMGRELPEPDGGASAPKAAKKEKLSKPLHSAKAFKQELKAHLKAKTGDDKLDAVNAGTADRLK